MKKEKGRRPKVVVQKKGKGGVKARLTSPGLVLIGGGERVKLGEKKKRKKGKRKETIFLILNNL